MQKMAELIKDIHSRNHLIHHRFHLRIEIDNLDAYEIAEEMIKNGKVHEISFMDHTPGQGQYRNLEIYRSTIAKYQGRDQDEIQMEQLLQEQMEKKTLSAAQMQQLTKMAQERKIAVASHDDDTEEKMALNREIGVTISEFPVTLAAARKAKDMGFQTVVGAPNIMLGGSHSGNLSAAEAILDGCADILCSDYYPPAILHSIFHMHENYGVPLPEMVKKATLNPAQESPRF